MKKTVLLFVLALNFMLGFGQNLVQNGSFEQYTTCPFTTSQVDSCIGWKDVLNTPDFFNTCSPYPVGIPSNILGYQYPFDGHAYVGLYTYSWYAYNYREVIGAQFNETMRQGATYHISMRVSRGNHTNMANINASSNHLGMRFTSKPYTAKDTPVINNFAQLHEDSILKDTLGWDLLSWNFKSDSAYNYFYIGNFFTDAETDTSLNDTFPSDSYYYIDSVNINCMNCTLGISSPTVKIGIWLNNSFKQIQISPPTGDIISVLVVNILGQNVKFKQGINTQFIPTSDIFPGIYIVLVKDKTGIFTKKIVID